MQGTKQFNPEKTRFWHNELRSSEARKTEEMMKRNSYPEIILLYEGMEFNSDQNLNSTKRTLAYMQDYFPNTNQLLSEIIYQDPEPVLEPTKPYSTNGMGQEVDVELNADIMKGALKYGIRKMEMRLENRIAGFDMLYAGMCFVEVNHKIEKPPEAPIQELNILGKIKKAFTKEDIEKERAEAEPEPEKPYSLEEETYCRRWNPLNCGVDYRAERVKDIRFVYKKIKIPYSEFITKWPDYKDKVKPDAGELSYTTHKNDGDRKLVLYYEVQHLLKDGTVENFIIAPSYLEEEIDYWTRPYKTNRFNIKIGVLDEYGRLYPKSRAAIAKPNHDDKTNYKTFLMEVAEKSIPKVGYNKNKVKDDGIRGLESKKTGTLVPCDGGQESTWGIDPPKVSIENKELIAMFEKETEDIWGVSKARRMGRSDSEFATELEIQEAGFQERRIDIQEGLRRLWREELDGLKDIIVSFWDGEYFFKITGSDKPSWYIPQKSVDPLTGQEMVLNPLSDILTADYECDIDITSTLKPNKQRQMKDTIDFLTWLIQTALPTVLMPQGQTVSVEEIKRISKEVGFNPEKLIVPVQMPALPPIGGEMGQGVLPPEGVPIA